MKIPDNNLNEKIFIKGTIDVNKIVRKWNKENEPEFNFLELV